MSDEKNDLTSGQKAYYTRLINSFKKDANKVLTNVRKLTDDLSLKIESNEELLLEIESSQERLNNISEKLKIIDIQVFNKNEKGYILSEEIKNFGDSFDETKDKIAKTKNEINSYNNELFGVETDDGELINGIKQRIEGYQEKIETSISANDNKQKELFNKIEDMLKGASTVALATSFNQHKNSFNTQNWIWLGLFVISVGSMMGLSIWAFTTSDLKLEEMWKSTLGNLPFLAGAVWLAIYSSKQRSQNKRLQQEYAFKEDVAKIYYGLKQEIEELGESELGKKLNEKILEIIIDTVSLNPSNTLDNKSHNDKGPILGAIAEVANTDKTNNN